MLKAALLTIALLPLRVVHTVTLLVVARISACGSFYRTEMMSFDNDG